MKQAQQTDPLPIRERRLLHGTAYSKELLEQAIEPTNQFPFPWSIDADGTQRNASHQRFYGQTFNPKLQGIELHFLILVRANTHD